ncbi:MAG: ral secretion pathway protein, partial [Abditibacteriota bacterium]|nr:ral secretion pathway protein [Abditibacteriota bacterium]
MKRSTVTYLNRIANADRGDASSRRQLVLGPPTARAMRSGFTLVQLLVALAIITVLASVLMSVFGRGRVAAQRAQCDMRLKAVAVALDAFRQENGTYPEALNELTARKYLDSSEFLFCPLDENEGAKSTAGLGYEEFYVPRAPRNEPEQPGQLPLPDVKSQPILVCPLHEEDGHGLQAFAGTYTRQFATRPAILEGANATTVKSPGKNEVPGRAGMELHGGDLIKTAGSGSAKIRFADHSTAELKGGSRLTVLQSFLMGQTSGSLYTMLRQHLGTVVYIHEGTSKFDVSTPTATAGALGTRFEIRVPESAVAETGE